MDKINSTCTQRGGKKGGNCRMGSMMNIESLCIFAMTSNLKFKENFVVFSKDLPSHLYVPSQKLETPQQ